MQNLDGGRGKLRIFDITAPGFEPARFGATAEALMGQIHGVLPDGRVITGMGVFRHAYRALAESGSIGARVTSAMVSVTGWPLIRPLADCFYRCFARHRIRISAAAARLLGETPAISCEGDRCKVP